MQCLQRYDWVKLLRSHLPEGKGVMGAWAKLASRAAFRKGNAYYCGFSNPVEPGMWAGGVVGLKSILGAKKRHQALQTMERLQELGLISYELDPATKKLTYQILDWVVKCSGAECMDGAVYTTDGYGFLCLPRNITQRLAAINYQFEEADAWLDLWCHTVSNDRRNVFSFMAPAVQYGKYGAILTLETLGQRWGWEKTTATAMMLSVQPMLAANDTIWTRFSTIMKDIYGQLVGISTIVAVTMAAVALLVRMISRNQRAVDEATSWLKRIVVTWVILNTLGFIVAYLQPLVQGGNYSP